MSVGILGGGLAGLTCAFHLHERHIPFTLFEANSQCGGLARTHTLNEFAYDSGAHRIHHVDEQSSLWLKQLLDNKIVEVNKRSAIYRFNKLIEFPLAPLNLLTQLPVNKISPYLKDWLRRPKGPALNFEDHAIKRFGQSLAQDFVLDYSAKLWGKNPKELSLELGTTRLRSLNVTSLIRELIFRGGKRHQHLDGRFSYPVGGFGKIASALENSLPQSSIKCSQKILSLKKDLDGFNIETDQDRFKHDILVNTLPLKLFSSMLGLELPPRIFQFRHLVTTFVTLNQTQVSPHVSLYFPDPRIEITRAHEPRNRWSGMSPEGKTSLLIETPMGKYNPQKSEHISHQALKVLCQMKLISKQDILDSQSRFIPNAYPIVTNKCLSTREKILREIESDSHIYCCGRSARFSYVHSHDIFREARDLAEKIECELSASKPDVLSSGFRLDPGNSVASSGNCC